MTRTMYDSITAASIPANADMVAGYIDANYAWSAADWARFPHATKVRITVYPWTHDGHVIDIEPGNWKPPAAPGWCRMRRAAGAIPSVYTMRSWWQWCIDEFNRQGEPQPEYWIADWDNHAAVPNGAVAKQYASGAMLGAGYDLSAVADYWPGVDEEDNMPSAADVAKEVWLYPLWSNHLKQHIEAGTLLATVQAVKAEQAGLSAAVAALSTDADLTAERVEQIVRQAVEQHIQITGTVTVTGRDEGNAQ